MAKVGIMAQLERDILLLQGYKSNLHHANLDVGLDPIKQAFPSSVFPLAAIHEFLAAKPEESTAASGFIAGILSTLMKSSGAVLWLNAKQTVFPHALTTFGVAADKIIFVTLKKEKELLWATEEALKCKSLAAVVSEAADFSFTDSRRFQLAVEESGATGFMLRRNPRNLTTACISRWRIHSLSSNAIQGLPGVGFPRWQVELLKVRNGKSGTWQMEWKEGKFAPVYKTPSMVKEAQRKTG